MNSSSSTMLPVDFDVVSYAVRRDIHQALMSVESASAALRAMIDEASFRSETMRALQLALDELNDSALTAMLRLHSVQWSVRP